MAEANSTLVAGDSHRLSVSDGARYVSIGVLAKACGLSTQTLREYERRDLLGCVRSIGGHRRYDLHSSLKQLFGLQDEGKKEGESGRPIAYARVSGRGQSKGFDHEQQVGREGQQSDLLRQVERLKAFAVENYGVEPIVFSDTGSGMSPSRKNFNRMLDRILAGEFRGSSLLITYRERLIRFHFQLVERMCQFGGVKIVILDKDEDEEKDLMVEIAEDVTALIGHMHARINGQKSAKANTKNVSSETIQLAVKLHQEGNSWWSIVNRLKAAGHQTANGDPISYHVLKKNIADNLDELEPVVGSDENVNSFIEWGEDNLKKKRDAHTRLEYIHSAYSSWCKANDIEPLSNRMCGRFLRSHFKFTSSNKWSGHTEYLGVVVK